MTEQRAFAPPPRIEERGDGKPPMICGYAARFGVLSDPIGGRFREKIAPGAFKRYLEGGGDVVALWDHDSGKPLGRRSVGTLRVYEDSAGLRYEIEPPDTTWGRDAVAAIRRGDVQGSSFGFNCKKDAWEDRDADMPIRELQDVDVFDVSPVTYPAYPQTEVALRSLEAHRQRTYNVRQKARLRLASTV